MTQDNNNTHQNDEDPKAHGTESNSNPDAEATSKIDWNAELERARADADKYKNEFLYLKAEFDTYKRNAIKERSDLLKYGSEKVLIELLDVVDNFERALQVEVNAQNFSSFVKGIEMISGEFQNVLTRFGLREVPSEGKAFDPNLHEALTSEESASIPAGHVTKVFRKAYKLHDKVIRTGQVVVAREPSPTSNA